MKKVNKLLEEKFGEGGYFKQSEKKYISKERRQSEKKRRKNVKAKNGKKYNKAKK